jgi:hypothetical protein
MEVAAPSTPIDGDKINVLAPTEDRYTVKTKDGVVDQDIVNKFKESHTES